MKIQKTYKSVESKTTNVTFCAYTQMAKKIHADLACQSVTRWELVNKQDYMTSLMLNTAPSKFILAHVKSCLTSAELSNDRDSVQYFQQFKKYDYLNLDSNNRTKCIVSFSKDEFSLPEGTYDVADEVYTITSKNSKYSTLPLGLKNILDSRKITLEVYTNSTREDITRLFLVVNSGVTLNAAELRNPILSNVASEIRELATRQRKLFLKGGVFSTKEVNRRKIDDYFAGLCAVYINGIDAKITPKGLKEMYHDENANKLANKFSKEMTRFLKVVGKKISVFNRENGLLDLFVLYLEQIRSGKKLSDDESFVTDYVNAQIELLKDKTEHQYRDTGRSATFSELLRSREIMFNKLRNKLITENFDASKYFIALDSRRSGNREEKLIAAKDQGWVTPEGVEIPMEDVLTTEFEIGHIVPHADGGKTELSNFAIQTKEDNRKLGKNPIQTLDISMGSVL